MVYRRGQLFRRPQRPSPLSSLPCFLLPVTHTALPLCRGEGDELAPSQVSPVWSLDYCSIAETRRPISSSSSVHTKWQGEVAEPLPRPQAGPLPPDLWQQTPWARGELQCESLSGALGLRRPADPVLCPCFGAGSWAHPAAPTRVEAEIPRGFCLFGFAIQTVAHRLSQSEPGLQWVWKMWPRVQGIEWACGCTSGKGLGAGGQGVFLVIVGGLLKCRAGEMPEGWGSGVPGPSLARPLARGDLATFFISEPQLPQLETDQQGPHPPHFRGLWPPMSHRGRW